MSESDDELRLVVGELIKHLNGWAYDLFPEGDYSDRWSQLKEWAEKIKSDYKDDND